MGNIRITKNGWKLSSVPMQYLGTRGTLLYRLRDENDFSIKFYGAMHLTVPATIGRRNREVKDNYE